MTYAYKPRRVKCPVCGKEVAVTKDDKLQPHIDRATRRQCGSSRGRKPRDA